MSDEVSEELREQVVEYFRKKGKMQTSRDVAGALDLDHKTARKVITELVNDGVLEFTSFGGATFIKLVEE